jgi:pyridoxamine 5'-phosphate oxidase
MQMQHRSVQTREHLWTQLSSNARTQFAWPEPGTPVVTDAANCLSIAVPTEGQAALQTFALLVMDIDEVDYVALRSNSRLRFQKVGTSWQKTRLNP